MKEIIFVLKAAIIAFVMVIAADNEAWMPKLCRQTISRQ
jgi:hypothetical protein